MGLHQQRPQSRFRVQLLRGPLPSGTCQVADSARGASSGDSVVEDLCLADLFDWVVSGDISCAAHSNPHAHTHTLHVVGSRAAVGCGYMV